MPYHGADLCRAIDEVLDIDAFNQEVDREKKDAAKLEKLRRVVKPLLIDALRTMDAEVEQ